MYIYMCVYMHLFIYMYVYIYMWTQDGIAACMWSDSHRYGSMSLGIYAKSDSASSGFLFGVRRSVSCLSQAEHVVAQGSRSGAHSLVLEEKLGGFHMLWPTF